MQTINNTKGIEKGLNKLDKLDNRYVHAESKFKEKCRTAIETRVKSMFPHVGVLNTVTLGGEQLMTEKMFAKNYKLNGVSYEFEPTSIETAKKNAPKGVKVIEGNIFTHKYKGNEQFIWFDFMTTLRNENVEELFNWIRNNPITNNCVFVVTYCLHSRKANEGHKQLFKTENKHDKYINDTLNFIRLDLENENVYVEGNPTIIRYCNTDIGKHSLPMAQFIFEVKKRK
jgi:hypothetical protein